MALPVIPFVVGLAAGSALTYLYKQRHGKVVRRRWPQREFWRGFGFDGPSVDREPVEDTIGLEERATGGR